MLDGHSVFCATTHHRRVNQYHARPKPENGATPPCGSASHLTDASITDTQVGKVSFISGVKPPSSLKCVS